MPRSYCIQWRVQRARNRGIRAPKARERRAGAQLSNASAIAIDAIREAILDGRLAPGSRLKEEQLASEFGISRTPIREALLVLQSDGLIEAAPNRGATVRSYAPADLDELYQLRAVLEGLAARVAAERISPAEIEILLESCGRFDGLRDSPDVKALVAENQFFHETILAATGSDRLIEMVRKVVEMPLVYRSFLWYSGEQRLISGHYHRQIAAALDARNTERAESIMKAHVYEARDFLVAEAAAFLPAAQQEEE